MAYSCTNGLTNPEQTTTHGNSQPDLKLVYFCAILYIDSFGPTTEISIKKLDLLYFTS